MGDITDKLQRLEQTKESIKAAIIRMGQPVADGDPFSAYADKITSIKTGADTSDATASAGDILSGKTAYSNGQRIEGTIPIKGEANLSASGAMVTVPAGYYPSAVSRAVGTADQAVPIISIGSGGLIKAIAAQNAGYVSAGTKSANEQMPTQAAATITPGTAAKTAVAAGRYTTGAVTVAGDGNLQPGNIRSGVSIFGVNGTLTGLSTCTCTLISNGITGWIGYTDVSGAHLIDFNSGTLNLQVLKNSFICIDGIRVGPYPTVSGGIQTLFETQMQLGTVWYTIAAFSVTGDGAITVQP